MLDFEQAYQELEQSRDDNYISLYDLFVLIRSLHPKLSDNQIATVLLDEFKKFRKDRDNAFSVSLIFDDVDEKYKELLSIDDIFLYKFTNKLHEDPIMEDFSELEQCLEYIEDNGIRPF